MPANDSFFYDGAVVNYLLNERYVNPSISEAFPISGGEVFSAYPPLYQAVLFLWMSVAGTSAFSAMVFHLLLFGAYLLVVLAILRRLRTPAWCVHVAGGFLLALTWHDRPDSLAHLLGMAAVYSWIRSSVFFDDAIDVRKRSGWAWGAAACVIATFATSFQIGAIYLLWVSAGMAVVALAGEDRFPWLPWFGMAAGSSAVVAAVVMTFPGFMEHARLTPSLTGWRVPTTLDLLKVARTVPGVLLVAVLVPVSWFKQRGPFDSPMGMRHDLVMLPGMCAAGAVVFACLVVLTPNTVAIATYLQPVLVAGYLGFCVSLFRGKTWLRLSVAALLVAILIGSVRAIGMTGWGMLCAADVSHGAAIKRVRAELAGDTPPAIAVLSAAYLYEGAGHSGVRTVHSDWLGRGRTGALAPDYDALVALKPERIILTQFDYFRRYAPVIRDLELAEGVEEIRVENTGSMLTPDSVPALQRLIQHISWAPVIIKINWADTP